MTRRFYRGESVMKISELTGAALDWAVAKCEEPVGGYKGWVQSDLDKGILHGMAYSDDWLFSGPIIEREKIELFIRDEKWFAYSSLSKPEDFYGETPLIAAMRCYVASKLGDEVELPEKLKEEESTPNSGDDVFTIDMFGRD